MTALRKHRQITRVPRQRCRGSLIGHRQPILFAVLLLAPSPAHGISVANDWTPRTVHHHLICPGPYFCGRISGIGEGDYIEIEGELCASRNERGQRARSPYDAALDRPCRFRRRRMTG